MRLTAALALLLAAPLSAQEVRELRFYGYAYDLESGRYLYTEVHQQRVSGERWLDGLITYLLPDGRVLGSKSLDFSAHPFVPLYRLDLPIEGYAEGISGIGERVTLWRRTPQSPEPSQESVPLREPMAGDSGIHGLIRARFADLMRGDTVRFHIAVAGSLDWFGFRARRVNPTTFEGRRAERIRLEPDSLLRFIADPMVLTYEPEQRRLLEYRGISNVHDPATGDAYNVYIAYFSTRPADAPPLPPGY